MVVKIRRFALRAPDGTYGYRVHLHAHGHDLLLARNLHQCLTQQQALAVADAHIMLLTNAEDKIELEGNPTDGMRLKDVQVRMRITTTSDGHCVAVGAYGRADKHIITYDSTTFETSIPEVVAKMHHGIALIATDLQNFGMTVPRDWTPNIKLFGTDVAFIVELRKSLEGDVEDVADTE